METEFVRAFIEKNRRERYVQFLGNPRRRHEIPDDLFHRLPFIEALATPIPAREETTESVEAMLRIKGAAKPAT